jgi:hypothetical protein
MRSAAVVFAAAIGVVWAGCGGSTDTSGGSGDDGGGGGGTHDASAAGDSQVGSDDSSASSPDGSTSPGSGPQCGMATCSMAQVCCVSLMSGQQQCVNQGSCNGFPLTCTAGTCGSGDVCCLSAGGGGGPDGGFGGGTMCTPQQCPQGQRQLCNSTSDCPPGDQCRPFFGGYRVCRRALGDGGGPPPPPQDAGTD